MTIIKVRGELSDLEIETSQISRIRSILDHEREEHPLAETAIDYVVRLYAKDTADVVMSNIRDNAPDELQNFANLTAPNGVSIWFSGPNNAMGPIPIPPSFLDEGIGSALQIGGKIQYVSETPQEVYQIIKRCGGAAIPIIETLHSASGVWDPEDA